MKALNFSRLRAGRRVTVVATSCLAIGALGIGSGVTAYAAAAPTGQDVTWAASTDRTGATLRNQTVRNIVRTSIGGQRLQVSLSNAFGTQPVTFSQVSVGIRASGASVVAGTNRPVTFSGSTSITVPPGAQVLSDPLSGSFAAQQDVAVSVYVQGNPGVVTGHNLAEQTSYVSTRGNHALEDAATAFTTPIQNWYFVAGLVLTEPTSVGTVATLGDSITDGYLSTADTNSRWPDVLARRLLGQPKADQLGVLNAGISGNKILSDGAGVSALARLDRDVLAQPGVETVILLEGINDLSGGATAAQVIAGQRQIVARAHAEGTCIIGGTLTPFGTSSLQEQADVRTVNRFIRSNREFDGVIDFNKVIRDPANPDRMLPAYDSGDGLHPNDTGYEAMGNAVDLASLSCTR